MPSRHTVAVAFPSRWGAVSLLLLLAQPAWAMDHISLHRDKRPIHVSGQILVKAQDGGRLLLAQDGVLWIIQPEEIERQQSDDQPFQLLGKQAMADQLLREMPPEFRIHTTAHYVICFNTSLAYAQWCGSLYERLFRAFYSYWNNRGITLHEPDCPLVALVFSDQRSYAEHAHGELGDATSSIIGYYNMRTNRVNMYDLTGIEGLNVKRRRISSAAHINQILSQPAAERTVATIVHEATHQLAFNSGLQTRYADNPFWVSEGIAVYFETPDLTSSKGWRTIGGVNRVNLFEFRKLLRNRPRDSLVTLLQDDKRFRDTERATAAYAEAWALNYFLIRTRRADYATFLRRLAQKQPLRESAGPERLAEFTAVFGELDQLDSEFVRYMRRVR